MKRLTIFLLAVSLALVAYAASPPPRQSSNNPNRLIAPSTPLVAVDPYFSIWSPADRLAEADTVHWTGKPHRLTSLIRIDGKTFRLMGKGPDEFAPLSQVGLEVLPTRTIYTFEGAATKVKLTFMTAALPDDLMVYSRPVTYLTWDATSTDEKEHKISVYFEASTDICVNNPSQPVKAEKVNNHTLRAGSIDQAV